MWNFCSKKTTRRKGNSPTIFRKKKKIKGDMIKVERPSLPMGKELEGNEPPNTRESEEVIVTGSSMGKYSKRKNRKTTNDDMDSITNNQMLTDNLINISQNLLHVQFPDAQGLEDTTLGPYLQFSIQRGDFFANPSHRSSALGPEVYIEVVPVQQQTNGTNCGLLVIANATSILFGLNAASVNYDESQLRQHLFSCIQNKKIVPFPTDKNMVHQKCTKEVFVFEIKCRICRLPDFKEDDSNPLQKLAECYACHRFYHRGCAMISIDFFNGGRFYECEECRR
eukprot:gene2420-2789_t